MISENCQSPTIMIQPVFAGSNYLGLIDLSIEPYLAIIKK